jgi:hypothetical protein
LILSAAWGRSSQKGTTGILPRETLNKFSDIHRC